jgi:hypothetical protein
LTGFVNYFMKRNKTWKAPARVMMASLGGAIWTYSNSTKTLTSDNANPLSIDGISVSTNDRVLVNVAGASYNGIYIVTHPGSNFPAVFPLLTRDGDAGGPTSSTVLGTGFDIFEGSAIYITSGSGSSGTYWTINAPRKNNAILLDGTQPNTWVQTNGDTRDELCSMWFDGSWSVITASPQYTITFGA